MEDKINISELICTRISHDLIGNIGAFANAVELLEDEDDDFIDEIKNTLKTSSEVLTARLKFFRMAFGLTNANLENIETVKKVTEDYLQTLNLNHPVKADIKIINSPFNRAVMLACMCAAEVIVPAGNHHFRRKRQSAGTKQNIGHADGAGRRHAGKHFPICPALLPAKNSE